MGDLGVADVHAPAAISATKPAAFVIVRNEEGNVLTVSRPEPPHEQGLPGGGLDDGETPEQAACRELKEETGVIATSLRHVTDMTSPTDGRPVHVFEATSWTGNAYPAEPDTKVQWLGPAELVSQAVLYRSSLNALLVSGALHPPSNGDRRTMSELDTDARNKLKPNQFALPDKKKFPVHDADHTRNAAARLAQAKKAGTISDADYSTARGNIRRAAKKFGIHSELKDQLNPPPPKQLSLDPSAAPPQAGSKLRVRADLAPGGSLHVEHNMKDRGFYDCESVLLSETDAASDNNAPVWIQIAKSGTFLGHPAGPFELNAQVFREIVDNFKSTINRAIPVDYEHASEQDATSGSIPTQGAPAQGWIKDLKIDGGNLWGLVEWLPQARDQIRAKSYKFLSPAIRFNTKDRVSGKPAGARLSSVALTNQPYLDGLAPLAAKDTAVPAASFAAVTMAGKTMLDAPVHSPHAYMPKLRAALKMHETATPQQCGDVLGRIRDMCMSAGPTGMHSGIQLGDYTSALADIAGASSGSTWQDVFDVIEDMIDAAIGEHVIEDHGGVSSMPDDGTDDGSGDDYPINNTDRTMSDTQAIALKDAQTKTAELAVSLKDAETKVAKLGAEVSTLTLQLKEATAKATGAEEKLTAATEELKALKDEKAKRDEADLNADVDIAFATYKDKKGLADGDKAHMLSFARSSREAFNKMYPPVAPEHRHLMRTAVQPEQRERPQSSLSPTALARRLMTDKHMTYGEASSLAARILAGVEPSPFAEGK